MSSSSAAAPAGKSAVLKRFLLAMVEYEPRKLFGLLPDQNADTKKQISLLRRAIEEERPEFYELMDDEPLALAYLEKRLTQEEVVKVAAVLDTLGVVQQTRPLMEAMPVKSEYAAVVNGHLTLPAVVETPPEKLTHWRALHAMEFIIQAKANSWLVLFERADVFRSKMFDYAAKHGNLQLLEWAYQEKLPWSAKTTELAARKGQLDALKFLTAKNCPCDESATFAAAEGGNLDCLTFLHESNVPWDAGACEAAAFGGYLDVLRYLHAEGCAMDEATIYAAQKMGHDDCLAFLKNDDVKCPE
mmetsp:Transcript_5229/g.17134  ORF Transcript_5229/g.17134 Transcript_5229/m.17134 type:complete len:301 (-) Transcript_5229:2670-3572(-)